MVAVNIAYDTTNGRIISANLNAITPVPAGHSVTVKDLPGIESVFEKRVDPTTLELFDKDYLQVDSPTTVNHSTVQTVVFTKRDGETNEAKVDPADNETIAVSSRNADQSFSEADRKAFFDVLQTDLVSGAGQVKAAVGLAPGQETFVFFNDTLTPAFQVFTYV